MNARTQYPSEGRSATATSSKSNTLYKPKNIYKKDNRKVDDIKTNKLTNKLMCQSHVQKDKIISGIIGFINFLQTTSLETAKRRDATLILVPSVGSIMCLPFPFLFLFVKFKR